MTKVSDKRRGSGVVEVERERLSIPKLASWINGEPKVPDLPVMRLRK